MGADKKIQHQHIHTNFEGPDMMQKISEFFHNPFERIFIVPVRCRIGTYVDGIMMWKVVIAQP